MASVGTPPTTHLEDSANGQFSPKRPAAETKKSWQQLREAVKQTRRLGASLINRVPSNFNFRHMETPRGTVTRLYFLGVPQGGREYTIMYKDISPENVPDSPEGWTSLLQAFAAAPLKGRYSREEQLLRERQRMGSFGITSYDYNDDSIRFVFPAASSIYYCTDVADDDLKIEPVFPHEVKCVTTHPRLDSKICPSNSDLLAYISGNDIWVNNVVTENYARLTFTNKGLGSLKEDTKSAGVPSFVVQEEFDRYTGYWWQPKEANKNSECPVYRILYEEVDESDVELLHIVSSTDDNSTYDEYRYPRAGTNNAKYQLKMLEFQVSKDGEIINLVDKSLAEPLADTFGAEYLLRAGWTPDGKYVYCSLLDRLQHKLQLVIIPPAAFSPVTDDTDVAASLHTKKKVDMTVIYEETSDVWVKVHDCLHFFPQQKDDELSFIFASEKSGFRHLSLVTSRLGPVDHEDSMDTDSELLRCSVIEETPLTSGNWEVCERELWVDEQNKLVYFMGLKDTPLEAHLYVVSYGQPSSKIMRLTELGFSHIVAIDKLCSMFVTVYSSVTQPPASNIYRILRSPDGRIEAKACCTLLHPPVRTELSEDYISPNLFNFNSQSGEVLHGMYFRPRDFEPGRVYPTVLFVYGGPQVQLVTNSFKALKFLRLQTLTALGYVVVIVDSRGSANRGLKFESALQHKMGCVEIGDQVEGLQHLARQVDFIDLSRVAIHGWSYGGYLSIMGLVQRPDIFKVAIAGAPVTSWHLYDTGYTERFMDTPDRNPEGYKNGSILNYINSFPDDENRLLIVHGLIDENVHFLHTSTLVNALVRACKPYQLQVYPNERHGIRNSEASEHYETMVLSFLQKNL